MPETVELREARLEKRERESRALLDRIEVVLGRMEVALGLPPWGEELRPALRLVADGKGGD